jgi:hypothetical protein
VLCSVSSWEIKHQVALRCVFEKANLYTEKRIFAQRNSTGLFRSGLLRLCCNFFYCDYQIIKVNSYIDMSTYMFLHIYIDMLLVIISEINHLVHRKLPTLYYLQFSGQDRVSVYILRDKKDIF